MLGKSSTPKKFLIILLVISAAFFLGRSFTQKPKTKSVRPKVQANQLTINNHTIHIEIADTEDVRSKGLSGRDSLAAEEGMLFVFDRPAFYSFWMKDMKIPLDIIWIKGEKIVDISENIPFPKTQVLEELPTYTSKSAVDKVLEVNAGKVKEIKAKIGDKINLTRN